MTWGLGYERDNMSEENFIALWNHPFLRWMRKTVNTEEGNILCNYCRNENRFDPEHQETKNREFADRLNELIPGVARYTKTGLHIDGMKLLEKIEGINYSSKYRIFTESLKNYFRKISHLGFRF